MPSQTIVLPLDLLRRVTQQPDLERHLGLQHLGRLVETDTSCPLTIRIVADPQIHCPEAWSPLLGDVFVLLLSSVPGEQTGFRPLPLADATVIGIREVVREALTALKGLSAHEKMALARAFRDADACRAERRPGPATPATSIDNPALTQAGGLQSRFVDVISALDSKLASYRAIVSSRGLDYLTARLACQSELGAILHLRPHPSYREFSEPYFLAAPRRGHIVAQRNACENMANALDDVFRSVGPHFASHRAAIDNNLVQRLHSLVMHALPGKDRRGEWRNRPVQIRSPFSGIISDVQVPHDLLPGAMREFEHTYLSARCSDLHPLIRAGMAHAEMVRIHPFLDGNGRTARLLFHAILIEAGWPLLPWEAIFLQCRPAYMAAVDEAARSNDLTPFIEFLLLACEQAIKLGFHMACLMKRERQLFVQALVPMDVSPREAQIFADWVLVHALTPDTLPPYGAFAGPQLVKVGETGRVDAVCYQGERCWSSPVARALLLPRSRESVAV